jgi:hypothetical protein
MVLDQYAHGVPENRNAMRALFENGYRVPVLYRYGASRLIACATAAGPGLHWPI